MKVLVLGASGMIGSAMIRVLSQKEDWQVFGTLRSIDAKHFFSATIAKKIVTNVNADNHDSLVSIFGQIHPNIVINCIALTGMASKGSSDSEWCLVKPMQLITMFGCICPKILTRLS